MIDTVRPVGLTVGPPWPWPYRSRRGLRVYRIGPEARSISISPLSRSIKRYSVSTRLASGPRSAATISLSAWSMICLPPYSRGMRARYPDPLRAMNPLSGGGAHGTAFATGRDDHPASPVYYVSGGDGAVVVSAHRPGAGTGDVTLMIMQRKRSFEQRQAQTHISSDRLSAVEACWRAANYLGAAPAVPAGQRPAAPPPSGPRTSSPACRASGARSRG